MSTHALASLTATYTDSEPEGEEEDKLLQDEKEKSESDSDRSDNIEISQEAFSLGSSATAGVARTLVSYNDDAAEDEDEEGEARPPSDSSPPPQIGSGVVELPPEPSGRISPRLLEKVARLHERKEAGVDMNALIQNRKEFRNPSIYEKLIQYCGINELGTNYPPHLYDPLRWGKHSFYEELARVQKIEMDRLEKEKKARVEFVSGTKRTTPDDDPKKRKSKWDQVGIGGMAGMMRTAPPSLTTSATGTKATVLSAFGSLPKKPKL